MNHSRSTLSFQIRQMVRSPLISRGMFSRVIRCIWRFSICWEMKYGIWIIFRRRSASRFLALSRNRFPEVHTFYELRFQEKRKRGRSLLRNNRTETPIGILSHLLLLRSPSQARVVKLADTLCSGRSNRKVVRVQVSPRAQRILDKG